MKKRIKKLKSFQEYNNSLLDKSKALTEQEYLTMRADILRRLRKDYTGDDKLTINLNDI